MGAGVGGIMAIGILIAFVPSIFFVFIVFFDDYMFKNHYEKWRAFYMGERDESEFIKKEEPPIKGQQPMYMANHNKGRVYCDGCGRSPMMISQAWAIDEHGSMCPTCQIWMYGN